MNVLSFTRSKPQPGAFHYPALDMKAHHKPIDGIAMMVANSKATRATLAEGDEVEALVEAGVDRVIFDTPELRAGLQHWLQHALIWLAVVESVEVTREGETFRAPMPETEVYRLFAFDPDFLPAWEAYLTADAAKHRPTLSLIKTEA